MNEKKGVSSRDTIFSRYSTQFFLTTLLSSATNDERFNDDAQTLPKQCAARGERRSKSAVILLFAAEKKVRGYSAT